MGVPLAPTISAVTGGVGQLEVKWSAPAINADLGVTYTLAIYDVTAGRTPATAAVQGLVLDGSPLSVTGLVAGTKRVQITAANSNTAQYSAVVQTSLSDEAEVALSTAPGVSQVVGSAAGAAISVTRPSQVSTAELKTFLVQVRLAFIAEPLSCRGWGGSTFGFPACLSQRYAHLPLIIQYFQKQLHYYDRLVQAHDKDGNALGTPKSVDATAADFAGPWTVFWPQTVPQLLSFRVRGALLLFVQRVVLTWK